MKIKEKILIELSDITVVKKILLFGSRATNTASERSDYDLCIVVSNYDYNDQILKKIANLMGLNNIMVHPFIYTENDYKIRKDLNIFKESFENSIKLFER